MNEHFYYNIGNRDNIFISNSSLFNIDPFNGGDPRKFLNFFDDNKESLSSYYIENGKMLHKYIENPEIFKVSEVDKPSGKMGELCDVMYELCSIENVPLTSTMIDVSLADQNRAMKLLFDAREKVDFNKNLKPETFISQFTTQGLTYVVTRLRNKDFHVITKESKDVLDNCITSLKENANTRKWILTKTPPSGVDIYSEIGVVWRESVVPIADKFGSSKYEPIDLDYKGLLDKLIINRNHKRIFIIDLKTITENYNTYSLRFNSELGIKDGGLFKRKVYRQLALYKRGIHEVIRSQGKSGECFDNNQNIIDLKIDPSELADWKFYCNVIVVETKDLFRSACIGLPNQLLFKGLDEIRNLSSRIAWHKMKNDWSASMEEIVSGNLRVDI